jgi:soluble lytic murein transglycosylase-like protein
VRSGVGVGVGAFLLATVPLRMADLARPIPFVATQALSGAPSETPPGAPPDPLRTWLVAELAERVPELGEGGVAGLAGVILDESAATRLDPVLVLAIIEVESGWEPDAVSNRGARGLMQLRPATLESEARDGGFSAEDGDGPTTNVRAGIRYFARMVRQFGDVDLALVAYNAGPTRLASYVQAVGEVPDHLLGYARRVRREERLLRRAIGPAAQPLVASAAGERSR